MSPLTRVLIVVALVTSMLSFVGCKSQQAGIIPGLQEDVNKPVEGWGLRKLEPKDYPDMRVAWMDQTNLERAIDKSLQFLAAPSSAHFYPSANPGDTITHDQIAATLYDIKDLLHKNITPDQFQQQVLTRYDVYTSKGFNDNEDVWFTAYYTPIYYGSLTPTAEFRYPVYRRPPDLQSDPLTGEVMGTYPTRRDLVQSGRLRGLEFVYFRKPIEPFIIQVQGSAKVILPDGRVMFLGYAGSNGQPHKGVGSALVRDGKIDAKHLSLPAMLAYFDAHPDELDGYVLQDDRFVFLKEYSQEWPAGSLGVQVTADRTLATDKSIFPRASLTFVDVPKPTSSGESLPYKGLLLDQDTGGGIRAAGRADMYMGIGDKAGELAGHQYARGRLYYLFLKPDLINPAAFPKLKPVPAPKGATTGTPRRAMPRPVQPGTGTSGPDEMFPGAVRK